MVENTNTYSSTSDVRRSIRGGIRYLASSVPALPLFPRETYQFTLGALHPQASLGVGSQALRKLRFEESALLVRRLKETAKQILSAGGPDILLDPPTPLVSGAALAVLYAPGEAPALSAYVKLPPEDPPVYADPGVVLLHYVALQCYFADVFRLHTAAFFRLRSLSNVPSRFEHPNLLNAAMRACAALQNRILSGATGRPARVDRFPERYASAFPEEHRAPVKKVLRHFQPEHLDAAARYLRSLFTGFPIPYPAALESPPPATAPIEVNRQPARPPKPDGASTGFPDRSVPAAADSLGEMAQTAELGRLPREAGVRAAAGELPPLSLPLFPDSQRRLFRVIGPRGRISWHKSAKRVDDYLAAEKEVRAEIVKVWEECGRRDPARDKAPVYFRVDGQPRARFFYIDPAELPSKEDLAAESDPQLLDFYHRALQCAIAERLLAFQEVDAACTRYRNLWQRPFRARSPVPTEAAGELAEWRREREKNRANFHQLTHARASIFREIVSDLAHRMNRVTLSIQPALRA